MLFVRGYIGVYELVLKKVLLFISVFFIDIFLPFACTWIQTSYSQDSRRMRRENNAPKKRGKGREKVEGNCILNFPVFWVYFLFLLFFFFSGGWVRLLASRIRTRWWIRTLCLLSWIITDVDGIFFFFPWFFFYPFVLFSFFSLAFEDELTKDKFLLCFFVLYWSISIFYFTRIHHTTRWQNKKIFTIIN